MISQFSTQELKAELERRETIENTRIKLFHYFEETDPYLLICSDDNKLKFVVRDEYTYWNNPISTIGTNYLIQLRDLCIALIN